MPRTAFPADADRRALVERLRDATGLLESIATDRSVLAMLSDDDRVRLLAAVARVYHPDRSERRRMMRAAANQRKAERVRDTEEVRADTGIIGTNVQDRAIQESMGTVADRTLERLGTTDRAIINARRTLLKAVQTVQDGDNPPGVAPTYYKLRAIDRVLPAGVPWFDALKADMYQLPDAKQPASTP